MSGSSSYPPLPTVRQRLNTLRYQHAVVNCGQKLLHLIMSILIIGSIDNIKQCVFEKLGSNKQFNNSFTKDEHQLLDKGEHRTWDISMLFKIIQKICGLEPAGIIWTQYTGGVESLEYLITSLKELRNKEVHNFSEVLSKEQMEAKLTELIKMAVKIIAALGSRARELGKKISDVEANGTMNLVYDIVAQVKEEINESAPAPAVAVPESVCSASNKVSKNMSNNDDEDDYYESDNIQSDSIQSDNIQSDKPQALAFDSAFTAAGTGGEAPLEQSLEEQMLHDLSRQFWALAGSG